MYHNHSTKKELMKQKLSIFTVLFAVFYLAAISNPLLAQWVQTNGPNGSNLFCLAVSGTNLFAGTQGGGVFLSTDDGTSWTAVNSGLTNTTVRAFAVSGTNLFAGTAGGGVFLSTDNGTNWTAANSGLTGTDVYGFAASGTNPFAAHIKQVSGADLCRRLHL